MMRNRLLLWIRDQSGHSRRTILDRFPIVVGKTDIWTICSWQDKHRP